MESTIDYGKNNLMKLICKNINIQMKLNLDINHYLSDKDKGEKPIVILIKGAVIYLILLIVSILVISYAHHIGWPKELKPKENITKDTILMLIVIGPIIEETIHRLWLSFHKTEIIISVTCISFFILGELYHIDDKYIRILTNLDKISEL